GDADVGECVCLMPTDRRVSDQFNEDLCACQSAGEVCFRTCGDIYPQDCIGGSCGSTSCGDGTVDLFDILEMIDIILGLQHPTAFALGNSDVPNRMAPYCGNLHCNSNSKVEAHLNIIDVMVINEKALCKANCWDYCFFGQI